MWKFMPYIAKNLWRNRTRSMLTVSGAAVAMFVFTFVGSVQEGMENLNRGSQTERTLIVFQANRQRPKSFNTAWYPDETFASYAKTLATQREALAHPSRRVR